MTMRSVAAEERHVLEVLASARFQAMEGLGGEVPYFIWAYPPEWELDVQEATRRLLVNLRTIQGLNILHIDLYELAISLLNRRNNFLERLEQREPTRDKDSFRKDLQRVLDPEKHVIPEIGQRITANPDYDTLLLTGIGRVYPFIRSHNVLNNLQSIATNKPMLMLFPGEYRQTRDLGSALVLFGKLSDDQYYRAKNILDMQAGIA